MFNFYENTSIWPCCLSLVCWDYYDYLSNLHPQVEDVILIIFTGPEQLRATGNQLIKTFSIQSFLWLLTSGRLQWIQPIEASRTWCYPMLNPSQKTVHEETPPCGSEKDTGPFIMLTISWNYCSNASAFPRNTTTGAPRSIERQVTFDRTSLFRLRVVWSLSVVESVLCVCDLLHF